MNALALLLRYLDNEKWAHSIYPAACSNLLVFRREVSAFVMGNPKDNSASLVDITSSNCGSSVEFNFELIWDKYKSIFNGNKPKQVVMIHSHPEGFLQMSSIDTNMIHGWRLALGCDIIFPILNQEVATIYKCSKKYSGKNESQITFGGSLVFGANYYPRNIHNEGILLEDFEIFNEPYSHLYKIIYALSSISDEEYESCDLSSIKEELQCLKLNV